MKYLKKAPWLAAGGAFFMSLVALLPASQNPEARIAATSQPSHQKVVSKDSYCALEGVGEAVSVAQVYDGDTLLLEDGRKVRLLGLNTPELGRGKKPDQAFAREAKRAVEHFFADGQQIWIQTDSQLLDKHGRVLAHVFKGGSMEQSINLEQTLLESGLAWHVAVPPNLGLAPCLANAESKAQQAGRGVWASYKPTVLADERIKEGGYQRITARVSKVVFANAWWISFGDGYSGVIYPEHQRYFSRREVAAWEGQWLELEGWVYKASYKNRPQWRIKLETPYAVTKTDY